MIDFINTLSANDLLSQYPRLWWGANFCKVQICVNIYEQKELSQSIVSQFAEKLWRKEWCSHNIMSRTIPAEINLWNVCISIHWISKWFHAWRSAYTRYALKYSSNQEITTNYNFIFRAGPSARFLACLGAVVIFFWIWHVCF